MTQGATRGPVAAPSAGSPKASTITGQPRSPARPGVPTVSQGPKPERSSVVATSTGAVLPKRSSGPSFTSEAKSAAVAPPAPPRLSTQAIEEGNDEKTRVEPLFVRTAQQRGAPEPPAPSKATTTEDTPEPSSARPTHPPPPILDPQDVRALIEQAAAPLERQLREVERRLGEMQRRLDEVERRPAAVGAPAAVASIAPVPSAAPAPRVLSGFPGPVSSPVAATVQAGVATASRPPAISRPVIELAPSVRPVPVETTDALVIDGRRRKLRLALAVVGMLVVVFGGLFAALAESYTHAHP
jgi:hypothetical protein